MADKPSKGLADVVAASTALTDIDGRAGRLFYRGHDIHDLANAATFEEIACLLRRGAPPGPGELAGFRSELAAGQALGALVAGSLEPDNRLIRPDSEHIGERGLSWTRLDQR